MYSEHHGLSDSDQLCLARSRAYLAQLRSVFEGEGFAVRLQTQTPDADFLTCASASAFIATLGGFSQLAAQCVRRNNGTVLALHRGVTR